MLNTWSNFWKAGREGRLVGADSSGCSWQEEDQTLLGTHFLSPPLNRLIVPFKIQLVFTLLWRGKYYSWLSYAYISLLRQWFFFLFLSLLHHYHQVSPKLCCRIESLLSAWLYVSGITKLQLFSWRHSPWSSPCFPAPIWTLLPASATQLSSETHLHIL